jgi:gliding motility-associated protein GldL
MSKKMKENKSANKSHSGFMGWYESYTGKKVVGCVYSLGASIVIIGALFKIMHFPGAGPMLIAGMSVEAILFAIGCLDKPHADFHWENVFPQLVGYGADPELIKELETRPRPTLLGGGAGSADAASSSAPVAVPALDEKELESLKSGIAGLAKTATQLSELGSLATVTNDLGGKLEAAGAAAEKFATAGEAVCEKSSLLGDTYVQVANDMQKVVAGTKAYESQVNAISTQLQSLNSVYELQLKALQAQADAYKAQTDKIANVSAQVDKLAVGVKSMLDSANGALESQKAYTAGAQQLAGQIADLNKVYGNMLNALS